MPNDRPDNSFVLFRDNARQIVGKIFMCPLTESGIMDAYDKGNYINISEDEFNEALRN